MLGELCVGECVGLSCCQALFDANIGRERIRYNVGAQRRWWLGPPAVREKRVEYLAFSTASELTARCGITRKRGLAVYTPLV